jgi:hypothetical protein
MYLPPNSAVAHKRNVFATGGPAWNIDGTLPPIQISNNFRLAPINGHPAKINVFVKRVIAGINFRTIRDKNNLFAVG